MTVGAWFGTDFDNPPRWLDVPVEVTGGQEDVHLVDQVTRGSGIVGRATGQFAAVALKLRPTGEPLRVTVTLLVDATSGRWWADRVRPPRREPERPRLILVNSQGALRAAAVLARSPGWLRSRAARADVTFELAEAELGADGLLVVELADAGTALPGWAAERLAAQAPIGVRIDRIHAEPPGHPAPLTSPRTDSGCGFAVLPGGFRTGQRVRLHTSTVPPAPPLARSPGNRWTRRRPARAVAKALRLLRRVTGRAAATFTSGTRVRTGRLDLWAADLTTGAECAVQVLRRDGTELDVLVAGPAAGPVLIGVRDRRRRRETTARQVACRITSTEPDDR